MYTIKSQSLLYQGSVLTERPKKASANCGLNPFFIRAPF